MSEKIQMNLASQILDAYREANQLAEQTKNYASQAIAKAIECGTLLTRQKESLGLGSWLEWLNIHLPEISDSTARRYMRLAKTAKALPNSSQTPENQSPDQSHVTDLFNAATLRQAYIAAGILPMPENKGDMSPDPNKPWVRFTRYLDGFRLWFNKRMDEDPLDTWPENSRRVLKNELKWFAELYERL
jgi:hypothetical protein